MKKIINLEQCPICDSPRVDIRHDRSMRYRYLKKDHVLEGQEHTVCQDCGLSFYQPGQIDRNNQRFAAFEKSIVKGISPNEIRSLREEYLMTQDQAARIFDCGKTAFSKWERGEVAPTGPTALLLRMALENPGFMKSLADKAGETVDIRVTPSKLEENVAAFYSTGETMATRTVREYAMPAIGKIPASVALKGHAMPATGKILAAVTIEEHAMPAANLINHMVFAREQTHFHSVAAHGTINIKGGNKERKPSRNNIPSAWMINAMVSC